MNKTKSVILTDDGLRESERLFKQHFVCRWQQNRLMKRICNSQH
ncbi:DUF6429 family protein [Pseudomonas aeruginosa]